MSLAPAADLARLSKVHMPGESAEYRAAREALLGEEIELRRHIARVAEQRRALPPGAEVTTDYRFVGEAGEMSFAEMFGAHDTLVVYNYMFGPQRERPCPMCTTQLSSWDGEAPDIMRKVALAVVAGSPIERLLAFKRERGWHHLPLFQDIGQAYARDWHGLGDDGGDLPSYNVFTKRDGVIRHFWAEEMGMETADPGQDPRGAVELAPMWHIFDTTPAGRDPDWYPSLRYE